MQSGVQDFQNGLANFPDARAVLHAIRSGTWRTHTSGLTPDYVQGNLAILESDHADDFLRFCERNPKPCPLLAVGDVGDPKLATLGADLDIRTDVPAYRVYRNGELTAEVSHIADLWQDNFTAFVIGCSFSFEHALMDAGIPLRHVEQKRNVAMYRTNIQTRPAGVFHGPMVVSMRPLKAADAIRAVQVTARMPRIHGAPVHIGDPSLIGIENITHPDYGDPVEIMPDELPVFWACGVTPQAVVMASRPSLCITHAPGHMLITDLLNRDLLWS